MSYLSQAEADRIITQSELGQIGPIISSSSLALRCNLGSAYKGGDGYNLDTDDYDTNVKYATALYASICFSQDTITEKIDDYRLLLMKDCAVSTGETYTYRQGGDAYTTLPKCHGLGSTAEVVYAWNMNDSAIALARNVVEKILSL